MPKHHNNWSDMISEIENLDGINKQAPSYHFKNFYYMDDRLTPHGYNPDIPQYLHMMQHVFRSNISTGSLDNFHWYDRVLN